jgi:hypothetical protein
MISAGEPVPNPFPPWRLLETIPEGREEPGADISLKNLDVTGIVCLIGEDEGTRISGEESTVIVGRGGKEGGARLFLSFDKAYNQFKSCVWPW